MPGLPLCVCLSVCVFLPSDHSTDVTRPALGRLSDSDLVNKETEGERMHRQNYIMDLLEFRRVSLLVLDKYIFSEYSHLT